ncbi:MAG: glucose 1-dehydrogenase [Gammaproteobacteria bacterium]|nr:glucose 1-dehydrogenase [Gammaproteobacteria bacterium]
MAGLEGRVAIITGGSGGIGRAAAARFVEAGAKVLLVDLDADALAEVAASLGDSVATHVADVTDPDDSAAYVRAAVEAFGGVDILIANAGIEGTVKPIVEQDVEVLDRVLAVNVRGVWLGMKYAFPEMEKRGGGSVVIMSSVAGIKGTAGLSPYVTSKHAVIGLMRSAALEGAPSRIRVNTVNPSPVETRMMRSLEDGMVPGDAQTAHDRIASGIPLGRYAQPDEIAGLMLFLSSDDAGFLTGGVYMADGGISAT